MGLVIADIRFKKAHYKPGKVGTARSEQPTTVRKGFFFFRAVPAAYGDSQARGRIGAVAAGLDHSPSNTGSKLRLQPTPQFTAMLDP